MPPVDGLEIAPGRPDLLGPPPEVLELLDDVDEEPPQWQPIR